MKYQPTRACDSCDFVVVNLVWVFHDETSGDCTVNDNYHWLRHIHQKLLIIKILKHFWFLLLPEMLASISYRSVSMCVFKTIVREESGSLENNISAKFSFIPDSATSQFLIYVIMLLPSSFVSKKSHILSSLSVPAEEYDDLSPKGSIDAGIRDLIDNINAQEGFVTTSSCAGRISVFLEGKKATGSDADEESTDVKGVVTTAGIGGKGGGGRWLFVSHDPVVDEYDGFWAERLGVRNRPDEKALQDRITRETRLIHFKFEPMVSFFTYSNSHESNLELDPSHPHSISAARSGHPFSSHASWLSRERCFELDFLYLRVSHTNGGCALHGPSF
jgi:tRNA(Phe) wybutosine-synthesizing methylase Tyw3